MLVLAAGFAVLTAGAGLYMESFLSDQATGEFDTALMAKAQALASLTEMEGGEVAFDYEPKLMPEFERSERPDYFQFFFPKDKTFRSRRLDDSNLPRGDARILDVRLPDGRAGRMVRLTYVPKTDDEEEDEPGAPVVPATVGGAAGAPKVILAVARGRGHLDAILAKTRLTIFGAGGVAALLAVFLVWRALVSGFRPIEQIAAQVEALDAENLGARVELPHVPRELAPIVQQLNALLDRLESSCPRERRFTANVAHELRTPIAELRSLADVGAKWPDDKASIVRFFDDVNDIAGRMEGRIADLLLLARCHAGVEKVSSSPTNLKDVVASTWSRLSPGRRLEIAIPEDLVVESDPGKLEIILSNLLGNAASYSNSDGEIRCAAERNGTRFRLDVTNSADRLSPAELQNLAEPFWRKDEARSAEEHAGLGLSVVTALAALLRLEIGFEQDENGTFRARLAGPVS